MTNVPAGRARSNSPLDEAMRDAIRPLVRDEARAVLAEATAPLLISQHTAHLVGLTRRQFLDLLRREDFDLVVGRRGKLRFVDARDLRAWLLRADVAPADEPEIDAEARDLRELGLTPARQTIARPPWI